MRIHGRWCGPNWTDGRNISARDYLLEGGDFKSSCVDRLDCACRTHDRDCSGPGGCTSKGDRKLALAATKIFLTTTDPILKAKAQLVAAGMATTQLVRR